MRQFVEWLLQFRFLHWLWSQIPPRCIFHKMGECEHNYLRWTEGQITTLGDNPQRFYVCDDCVHKLRRLSMNAGHSVHHMPDGTVQYRPTK